MSELSDKLCSTRELPRHLQELGVLVGRPVDKTELLTVEETKEVRARANQVVRQPVAVFEIPFKAKSESRFAIFLKRLAEATSSDVYLWTPASNVCGVLRPLPLRAFQIAFPFDLNPDGIIVILTSDLRDQLLLDFSTRDHDEWLEVEAAGEHWGGIAY